MASESPQQYVIVNNTRRRIKDKRYWIDGSNHRAREEYAWIEDENGVGAARLVYKLVDNIEVYGYIPSERTDPAVYDGWLWMGGGDFDKMSDYFGLMLKGHPTPIMPSIYNEVRYQVSGLTPGNKYWVYAKTEAHDDAHGTAQVRVYQGEKTDPGIVATSGTVVLNHSDTDDDSDGSKIITAAGNTLTVRYAITDITDQYVILRHINLVDVTPLHKEAALSNNQIDKKCRQLCRYITDISVPVTIPIV